MTGSKEEKEILKNDKALIRLIDRYKKECRKNAEKCNSIPYGYGMRAYHRMKMLNFSKEDELKEKIRQFVVEHTVSEYLCKQLISLGI